MFSSKVATPSELGKLIEKATDPTLTSDNWQYILDVCDKISSNPEEYTREAIKWITLRLNTKDANVILRSLSLIIAVAENCGSRMQQEIASRSFLHDCIIKKLSERKIHRTVKCKIAEMINQLNQTFKADPSLKPMADAYNTVKTEYGQYLNQEADNGPTKPAKRRISDQDKQKEDEELQRVLKLSLQEYEHEKSLKKAYLDKPLPNPQQEPNKPVNKEEETIATVSKVRALYDLISYEPDELSFRKGDVITVIESVYRDWWRGSLPNGKVGIFPLNYVTPIVNKSRQELEKEEQEEEFILSTELRKVDRLLGLLSTNTDNEDEITQLYNELLPLRPSLAKYIEKYSSRKDELMTLNGQLNNQVKYFNELMDTLINQRINHQYSPATNTPYPKYQDSSVNSLPEFIPQQPTSSGFGNAFTPQQTNGYYPQSNMQSTGYPNPVNAQSTGNVQNSGYSNNGYSQHAGPQYSNQDYSHYYSPPKNNPQQGQYAPENLLNTQPTPTQYLNINNFPSVSDL